MRYRHYRNSDPPAIAEVWNEALVQRGAVEIRAPAALDAAVFNKPYFDPQGLIIAENDDKRVVGFAHGGFGPTDDFDALNRNHGVVCSLVVRSEYRRKGVGRELLRRCEDYLVACGARTIIAGGAWPNAPFYLGVYGGSNAPGLLQSDALAEPFLLHNGYAPTQRARVFQRGLDTPLNIADTRFVGFRKRYHTHIINEARLGSWWKECVLGPLEPSEFRLDDRSSGITAAKVYYWEMKEYGWRWGAPAAGLFDLQVRSEFRGMGLGKYLLALLVKHLQEQYFGFVEAQVQEREDAVTKLFTNLGFAQVDTGITYQKMLSGGSVG